MKVPDGQDTQGWEGKTLTRRQLLERGAAVALAATVGPSLLAACGSSSSSSSSSASSGGEKVTLTFVSTGGGYQDAQTKAWLLPYMKAHPNVTIVQDSLLDYSKIKAMVESGNVTWDVVDVGGDFAQPDLCVPIDYSIVTGKPLPGIQFTSYRAAEQIGAYIIGYRTDKYSQAPQGWADFYDLARFPGKRGHWKNVNSGCFETALIADGVPIHSLYPLDIPRAFKKLDTIKKNIIWWDSGAQAVQLLSSGETPMIGIWDGRALSVRQAGKPVELQWNQEVAFDDFFIVPKGSKNVHAAMELIAYMTSPEHNGEFSKYWPVAPATQGATVDPSVKPNLPTTYLAQGFIQDDKWYAANGVAVDKQFQAWLQS